MLERTPPTIAISLGDPAGIGPEIVVRSLAQRPDLAVRVFGDRHVLDATADQLGLTRLPPAQVVDVGATEPGEVTPGRPSIASARAQLAYLEAAVEAVTRGGAAGLCTAPISKDWIGRVGFKFPGHTELLAARGGVDDFAMMLAGPRLRVVLATTHLALADVPRALTVKAVTTATVLAARALVEDFGIPRARVAVAGLNPHAGEAGRFGHEETRVLAPAIQAARATLAAERWPTEVTGPYPPDAIYRQAAAGAFDVVVAPYHDQGLIPVKLLHFDEAVNVTLGLPFVRTSPDHGTAYDIAGTGRARASSFSCALDLAVRLVARRSQARQPSEAEPAERLR